MNGPSARPAVHRVAVDPHARRAAADVDVDHHRVLERPVPGDAAAVEADAVRARAAQAERVAPVVEHRPLAARRDEQQHPRRAGHAVVGHQRLAHVVRRVRRARGVGDLAVELPAAVHARRRPDRRGHRGAAEVAVAEDLLLRALLEPRADLQRVVGGQAHAPGARRAAARELEHDAHVGLHVDLEAAVAARHEHPVEARRHELLVDVLRPDRCSPRPRPAVRSAAAAARSRGRSVPQQRCGQARRSSISLQ